MYLLYKGLSSLKNLQVARHHVSNFFNTRNELIYFLAGSMTELLNAAIF